MRKEEKTYYKTCVTEHTLTTFPYDISQNLIGFMASLENTHLVEWVVNVCKNGDQLSPSWPPLAGPVDPRVENPVKNTVDWCLFLIGDCFAYLPLILFVSLYLWHR